MEGVRYALWWILFFFLICDNDNMLFKIKKESDFMFDNIIRAFFA